VNLARDDFLLFFADLGCSGTAVMLVETNASTSIVPVLVGVVGCVVLIRYGGVMSSEWCEGPETKK